MFKRKEYKTTSKIRYAFMKAEARKKLGEFYVICDKHNRAVQTFEEVEIINQKAWDAVYELYPKLKGKNITYKSQNKFVIFINDENI